MKQYYIVSLKHTSKGDSALTLWRANGHGYCWYQDWAGVYSEEEIVKHQNYNNIAVEKELADALFKQTVYDGAIRMVLPNNRAVLTALNLNEKVMQPKKYRSCYMSF